MSERNEKEIAEKVMSEFAKFLKRMHEEYQIGHGMFLFSVNPNSAETIVGSVFGNKKTFDEYTEKRLREVAEQTIDGSAKHVLNHHEDLTSTDQSESDLVDEIVDKVSKLISDATTLATKKKVVWDIATKEGLVKDGKVDTEKLIEWAPSKEDYTNAKKLLEELIEERKED